MRVGGKVNMGLVGNCVHAPQQWNYREERWAIWTIGRPIGAGLVAKLRWKLRFSGFGSLQKRWVNHPEVICTAPSARPLRGAVPPDPSTYPFTRTSGDTSDRRLFVRPGTVALRH
jgi:hypothetical protein